MTNSRQARAALAAATLAMALAAAGGPALAANRVGTDGGETLVGTHRADQLEGKGGNDILKGLAGNDVYRFGNGWGDDTLEEKVRYRVDGKVKPGGVDTLDFSRVTVGPVKVFLIPEGGGASNYAVGGDGGRVALGTSPIENVVGGAFVGYIDTSTNDTLRGGGGKNTIDTGGGGDEDLADFGGWDDPQDPRYDILPSDDTYTGIAKNEGSVFVSDWGGSGDKVDLRPLNISQTMRIPIDLDQDGDADSLLIDPVSGPSVVLVGHVAAVDGNPLYASTGYRGRIETIVYQDGAVHADAGNIQAAATAGGVAAERLRTAEQGSVEAWQGLDHRGRPGEG